MCARAQPSMSQEPLACVHACCQQLAALRWTAAVLHVHRHSCPRPCGLRVQPGPDRHPGHRPLHPHRHPALLRSTWRVCTRRVRTARRVSRPASASPSTSSAASRCDSRACVCLRACVYVSLYCRGQQPDGCMPHPVVVVTASPVCRCAMCQACAACPKPSPTSHTRTHTHTHTHTHTTTTTITITTTNTTTAPLSCRRLRRTAAPPSWPPRWSATSSRPSTASRPTCPL